MNNNTTKIMMNCVNQVTCKTQFIDRELRQFCNPISAILYILSIVFITLLMASPISALRYTGKETAPKAMAATGNAVADTSLAPPDLTFGVTPLKQSVTRGETAKYLINLKDNRPSCKAVEASLITTLAEGQTKTYTIGGVTYEITAAFISESLTAKFTVNGETTGELHVGESYKVATGMVLAVTDIPRQTAVAEVQFSLAPPPKDCSVRTYTLTATGMNLPITLEQSAVTLNPGESANIPFTVDTSGYAATATSIPTIFASASTAVNGVSRAWSLNVYLYIQEKQEEPSFTVAIDPSSQTVEGGNDAIYTITLTDLRPSCGVVYATGQSGGGYANVPASQSAPSQPTTSSGVVKEVQSAGTGTAAGQGKETLLANPIKGPVEAVPVQNPCYAGTYRIFLDGMPLAWKIKDAQMVENGGASEAEKNAYRHAEISILPGETKAYTLVISSMIPSQAGSAGTYDFSVVVMPLMAGPGSAKQYAKAELIVGERNTPPVTPPPYPVEGKEATIPLSKGWNLVSIPAPLVKFEEPESGKKLIAFILRDDTKEFVTLQKAREVYGGGFNDYLTTHAFWVYSYDDGDLPVKVESNSQPTIQLSSGWNMIPVRYDFEGRTLNDVAQSCGITAAYAWSGSRQAWSRLATTHPFSNEEGQGFLVKTANSCTIPGTGPVTPPDFPNEQSCVGESGSIPAVPNHADCCPGLTLIKPKSGDLVGSYGFCTAKCGNNYCDSATETAYNCPQDCPATTGTLTIADIWTEKDTANPGTYDLYIKAIRPDGTPARQDRGDQIYLTLSKPADQYLSEDKIGHWGLYNGAHPDMYYWGLNIGCGSYTYRIRAVAKDGSQTIKDGKFALSCTGNPNAPCQDYDGNNYMTLGTVTTYDANGDKATYTDTCDANGMLIENICKGGQRDTLSYSCQSINSDFYCTAGHCVEKGTEQRNSSSCKDSDGQNFLNPGYVTVVDKNGAGISYPDTCEESGQVVEMTCQDGQPQKVWYPCQNYGSDYTCQNGACIKTGSPDTNSCSDSDGGQVFTVKGSVTGRSGTSAFTYNDYCLDDNRLGEAWCNGVTPQMKYTSCADFGGSCKDGACVRSSDQCRYAGETCGGIAGITCCSGTTCQLDGNYPDAGGKCVADAQTTQTMACPDGSAGKLVNEGPTNSHQWQNLGLTLAHPEISMYRIQWYNGKWSPWYYPGKWDIDWKTNGDGSPRRVWAYFDDHTHQYLVCPSRVAMVNDGGMKTSSCSDTDGTYDGNVLGTVSYTGTDMFGNAASGILSDYCIDANTVGEYYCASGSTQVNLAAASCANGCKSGACLPSGGSSPAVMKSGRVGLEEGSGR